MAAASCCEEIKQDILENLMDGLENGKVGIDPKNFKYLIVLLTL